MYTGPFYLAKPLAGAATLLTLDSCESIFGLGGNPELCKRQPANESVTDERVIVRTIQNSGPHERLVRDRVRYLTRGIVATLEKVRPEGACARWTTLRAPRIERLACLATSDAPGPFELAPSNSCEFAPLSLLYVSSR